LKQEIREYIKIAPKLGRGYLIDVSKADPVALSQLLDEYSSVAWGEVNWARHSEIAEDEAAVINEFVRGAKALEIGVGSGRVTRALAGKVETLVASDVIPGFEKHFANFTGNIQLVTDDIVNTRIEDQFDVVMFWENGLGAILAENDRRQALAN